jgi:hypothetical protein
MYIVKAYAMEEKRGADIPVRQLKDMAGWKTRAPFEAAFRACDA